MAGASPTQHVAPMSRQLNGASCTANSRQLLIGARRPLDPGQERGSPSPASCTDDIGGGSARAHRDSDTFIPCSSNTQCSSVRDDLRHRARSSAFRAARWRAARRPRAAPRRDVHLRQRHRRQPRRRLAGRAAADLRRHEPHHGGDDDPQRDRGRTPTARRSASPAARAARRATASATLRASTAPARCAACSSRLTGSSFAVRCAPWPSDRLHQHRAVPARPDLQRHHRAVPAGRVREDQARVPPRRSVGHHGRLPGAGRAAVAPGSVRRCEAARPRQLRRSPTIARP